VINYVYDGLNPLQEKNGVIVTANLLTGLGIDEFFTRTDGVGVRSLLPDALGSTVALGDGTGTLQTQYTYEPFGFTTQTGAASTSSYKFTGREDDGSGLYYYRARYFQPRLQRFIAEDPIGFRGGDMNLYAYVWNTPLQMRDSSGLRPGDSFDCEKDALKDAFEYSCKSGTDVEHGGQIYVMPNGTYSYTFASGPPTSDLPGAVGHVNPPTPPHGSRGTATSIFHSHRFRPKFNKDRSDLTPGKTNYLLLPNCKGIVRWDDELETEMPVNIK
jgi:RHS repeat-associated protein